MTTKTNYGKLLEVEIEDKGYSKKKISEHLKISENTLNVRLEDGGFTIEQMEILQDKRYLPTD